MCGRERQRETHTDREGDGERETEREREQTNKQQTVGYMWPNIKFNNVFIDFEGRVRDNLANIKLNQDVNGRVCVYDCYAWWQQFFSLSPNEGSLQHVVVKDPNVLRPTRKIAVAR